MSKFSTLATHGIAEKREVLKYEVLCHLLLHHKKKPHATIFSTFHSIHFNPDEVVHNWQGWLQAKVFEHPTWCTRADCWETELNPKLSIWVGTYCGKGIPPVELLSGKGRVIDFLQITKSLTPPASTATSSKGKQKQLIPSVAITAYIWDNNDDSLEEERQIKCEKDVSFIDPAEIEHSFLSVFKPTSANPRPLKK